jgi:hypothetical protein
VEQFVFADVTLTSKSSRIPPGVAQVVAEGRLNADSLLAQWSHRRIGLPEHGVHSLYWRGQDSTAARLVDAMAQFNGHASGADDGLAAPHERYWMEPARLAAPMAWA